MHSLMTALIFVAAIGCGLMAGVYFAFSAFVMGALGRVEPSEGIAAMNSINRTILRSPFMPLFFGTTIVALAIAVLFLFELEQPGSSASIAGGVIYIVGMFACTIAFNVPLNNALEAAGPAGPGSRSAWSRYLTEWTLWNHVRTVASTVATALFVAAIAMR